MNILLNDVRTTQDQVDAIAHLATSRLDVEGGGYLPGYLLVKRAFNRISRARPDLADPTIFLVWAKEFLFHDTWLALHMSSNGAVANDVMERLGQRLAIFESDRAAGLAERFAELCRTTRRSAWIGGWTPTLIEGLDLTPGGDDALRTQLGEINQLAAFANGTHDDPIAYITAYRTLNRDFFLLGRVTGELEQLNPPPSSPVKGFARFVPDPVTGIRNSLILVPITAPSPQPSSAATLDLLFWSSVGRTVAACYAGKDLVTQALHLGKLTPDGINVAKTFLDPQGPVQ